MTAGHHGGPPPGHRRLGDLVHLGQPGVDPAGVDHEAAEGEAGVEFDVGGADHAGVVDGALGGGDGVGAGFVEHGPVGGHGEHLGVHVGGRQAADQFLGDADLPPAVAAALRLDQHGPLGPEPGGAQGLGLLVQQVQGPLGDL
ncbi:hypothetical protein SFUMM280S_09088 [Streptomyces fumanus]